MGYHLKILTVPGHESPAAFQPVGPKTHTPALPLQDRGHRFYNTQLGRWIHRDPIGEAGGMYVHAFVENGTFNRIDYLGQEFNTELEIGKPFLASDSHIKSFSASMNVKFDNTCAQSGC
jgi:RHS repeat-associated protein